MHGERKTAPAVSTAVKEYMEENNLPLESVLVNLINEKIFTDKKEYTVELLTKKKPDTRQPPPESQDIEYAKSVLSKLLSLMRFYSFEITIDTKGTTAVLKISTPNKDGLLIGKNGQNLLALQYLLSIITDKKLKKHVPLLIDVDSYRDKRINHLRQLSKSLAEKAAENNAEVITDFLPSYERKLIHEEITSTDSLKTFSVGKGAYKKVVITPLL